MREGRIRSYHGNAFQIVSRRASTVSLIKAGDDCFLNAFNSTNERCARNETAGSMRHTRQPRQDGRIGTIDPTFPRTHRLGAQG